MLPQQCNKINDTILHDTGLGDGRINMELDPFLALDHVPVTPPPVPAPAPAAMDHGTDDVDPSSSHASNDAGVDPVASILDEPIPSSPSSKGASSSASQPQPQLVAPPSSSSSGTATDTGTGTGTGTGNPPARDLPTSHEDFQEELATLLLTNALPQSSITALQNLLRENAALKEKNAKLKSLLGRSAKAQRDAKNELEAMKKAYEVSQAEVERLEKRVEVLANRPTHMDLLADFETNFDRALLSIGGGSGKRGKTQQAGGEDPDSRDFASAEEEDFYRDGDDDGDDDGDLRRNNHTHSNRYDNHNHNNANNHNHNHNRHPSSRKTSDSLLTSELNEANARISHLESLHSSLHQRHAHLEQTHSALVSDHHHLKSTLTNLQLELRMSKMETEHALRDVRDREASLREMQLEIDLVTASAAEANRRAAEGMEVARVARTDKEYVDGLEAKVTALQEWALASTESKRLTVERCRELEGRVKELEGERLTLLGELERRGVGEGGLDLELEGGGGLGEGVGGKVVPSIKRTNSSKSLVSHADNERVLWSKSSSLVVGAGMVGHAFLELGQVHIEPYETVILRWKFDLTPADLDIYFSVLKGICEDKKKQRAADACFRSRHVQGGGGGDVSGAFAIQNACTLVWSNEMSWVRPRTIKWTVEAVAIEWSD